MTVNRPPKREEMDELNKVRSGMAKIDLGAPPPPPKKGKRPVQPPKKGNPKGPSVYVPGAGQDEVAFYQDVFWALLNCNEFILNH